MSGKESKPQSTLATSSCPGARKAPLPANTPTPPRDGTMGDLWGDSEANSRCEHQLNDPPTRWRLSGQEEQRWVGPWLGFRFEVVVRENQSPGGECTHPLPGKDHNPDMLSKVQTPLHSPP